jgi:hypothetical protein
VQYTGKDGVEELENVGRSFEQGIVSVSNGVQSDHRIHPFQVSLRIQGHDSN